MPSTFCRRLWLVRRGVLAAPLLLLSACSIAASQPSQQTLLASAAAHVAPVPRVEYLPEFPSFNSQPLDHQIRLYTNYLWEHGRPDVLIVGSSRSLQGVDPNALQQALVEQGYPELRIYNFSVNGATAQVVDWMMRQLLEPSQLPRLIIWADGSRAFNSGKPDLTYQRIVGSAGYQRLAAGDRPIAQRPAPAESPPTVLTQIDADACTDLQAWLPFLQREGQCLPASAQAPPAVAAEPIQAGYAAFSTNLDQKGFQPVGQTYNPVTYYRQFPRVPGQFDDNYVPFRLSGSQEIATRALANYARGYQIPLVFVNLPLNRDYLDSFRLTRERQFQQHMQRLGGLYGFLALDLTQQWGSQHSYFADPSHLNQTGARAVANYLATHPNIDWERLAQRYR